MVPEVLRERLGLAAGQTLEIRERDGILDLVPTGAGVGLQAQSRPGTAVEEHAVPTLDAEAVRDFMDNVGR